MPYKWLLLHDGASAHTSKNTTKWLEDNKIEIYPHPANFPDLNPIE